MTTATASTDDSVRRIVASAFRPPTPPELSGDRFVDPPPMQAARTAPIESVPPIWRNRRRVRTSTGLRRGRPVMTGGELVGSEGLVLGLEVRERLPRRLVQERREHDR